MKKKQNNRGFTLVELIIAVAVLGIVISPLIANFIQSGRLNKRARVNLDATNMAQDIMEGASAYSAEEFIKLFQKGDTLSGSLLPNALSTYESHGECSASWDYNPDYFHYTPSGNAGTLQYVKSGTTDPDLSLTDYYFLVKGVEQGNNKNKYDLRFHLNTSLPINTNAKSVANIAKINGAYDSSVNVNSDELQQVASEFKTKSSKAGVDVSRFIEDMYRTITIDIKDTDGTGTNYTVAVNRNYAIKDPNRQNDLGLTASNASIDKITANVSNVQSNQLPRSIYLYYEGMPKSTESKRKDHIVVKNNTGKEMTVYLVRVQNKDDKSSSDTQNYNTAYGAEVEIFSTNYAGAADDADPKTKIVSNLRFDLSADADKNVRVYKEDNTYIDSSSPHNSTTKYRNNRCTYRYNNQMISEALYQKVISDGYELNKKNYVYNLTLDVWDAKKNVQVASFTGSLSD